MSRVRVNPGAQPADAGTPAPRGRPRSAEAEEAILRTALEILGDVGYRSFSIEAVAARAGVGRPTIYRRWPSKLELAIEAVVRLSPPLKVTDTGDPLADLRRLVADLLPDMTSSAAGRAIIALASDPEVHGGLARHLDERYLRPRRAVLADLLRRAADADQIRPDLDLDLLIDLVLGAALYRWLTTGQPVNRQTARHITDTVLDLAAPRP
jgi:AcrR family transcriptional regulator